MSERFFPDIDPTAIREQALTEQTMAEYANNALANSVVSVNVEECRHPFINLPKNVARTFSDLPKPPTGVDSIDLQLKYDPNASMFITSAARLHFDTDYSLIFYLIKAQNTGTKNHHYAHLVTDSLGRVVRKSRYQDTMSEKEVSKVLSTVGVSVPESPQEASWDEIKAILQFAGLWSAQTSNTAQLDPSRSVTITDCLEGSSLDSETKFLDADDGFRSRQITLTIDEASKPTEPPQATWKLIAKTESRDETPCIKTLERVPLQHQAGVFNEDYGIDVVLEQPYVRHELTDQAVEFPLEKTYLQAARNAIAAASKFLH